MRCVTPENPQHEVLGSVCRVLELCKITFSALSLHRTRRETLNEITLQEHEDDRDRDGRDDGGRNWQV